LRLFGIEIGCFYFPLVSNLKKRKQQQSTTIYYSSFKIIHIMTLVKKNGVFATFPSLFEDFFGDNLHKLDRPSRYKWFDRVQASPAVNVREDASDFILEVAAPGLQKEDFAIELHDNILTISCQKQSEKTSTEKESEPKYTRREFSYMSFKRSFALPEDMVQADKIAAKYENGILHLQLPKRQTEAQPAKRLIAIS
jgi:HSP20 family protein